ncbi:MAG: iron ABC transporter permease [Syntrophobacteraceae bacterium]|nr:iron ABC transporter permease [Desulfobacteraceae bacterium]
MKNRALVPFLLLLLLAAVSFSLTLGNFPITWKELLGFFGQTLFGAEIMDEQKLKALRNILVGIRLPRVTAAGLAGAALSVSGAVFQSMFINPLVSPDLLGVLAGASFGAALGMILSNSWFAVQSNAFAFGLAAVTISVAMARLFRREGLLMLILGGIVSGSLFTALLTGLKYLADPQEQLPAIIYWLMGGFTMSDGKTTFLLTCPMLAGILVLFCLSSRLNILSMGDEEARSLGVNVGCVRAILIVVTTFISCLTVCLGGIIGWVGLVIPHIGRMLVGPDNRLLLPVVATIGATYLVIVDDFARTLFRVEIPLGILTALMGIPFFVVVVRKAGKGWG